MEKYSGVEYRVSGDLSNGKVVPANRSYRLLFETPGTYKYICGIHPGSMSGEVVVEAADVTDVPTQPDGRPKRRLKWSLCWRWLRRHVWRLQTLIWSGGRGPNGSSIWYVPAGMTGLDPRIEVYDFFPEEFND